MSVTIRCTLWGFSSAAASRVSPQIMRSVRVSPSLKCSAVSESTNFVSRPPHLPRTVRLVSLRLCLMRWYSR